MAKKKRQALILEIISKNKINNQKILVDKLEAKGFAITQATLSRDLQELKIGRMHDPLHGAIYVTSLPTASFTENNLEIDARAIRSAGFSGNLCVLKTQTGFANGIALSIDNLNIPDILGTIAGDDTILIIPKDKIKAATIKHILISYFPTIKPLF